MRRWVPRRAAAAWLGPRPSRTRPRRAPRGLGAGDVGVPRGAMDPKVLQRWGLEEIGSAILRFEFLPNRGNRTLLRDWDLHVNLSWLRWCHEDLYDHETWNGLFEFVEVTWVNVV